MQSQILHHRRSRNRRSRNRRSRSRRSRSRRSRSRHGFRAGATTDVLHAEPKVWIKGRGHIDAYNLTPVVGETLEWRVEHHPLLDVEVLIGRNDEFKVIDRAAFAFFRGWLWFIESPRELQSNSTMIVSKDEVLETFRLADLKDFETLKEELFHNAIVHSGLNDIETFFTGTDLSKIQFIWENDVAWSQSGKSGDSDDDWASDEDESDLPKGGGSKVPILPLVEISYLKDEYKLPEEVDDFWKSSGEKHKCLVPEFLFRYMFRVRQLDVSDDELKQMCAPLKASSVLRKSISKMAQVTAVSNVMENNDLRHLIFQS